MKRWPCHGCGKQLTASDLARNSTTHWDRACIREAIRRSEVREARREGIPVKLLRERQAVIHGRPNAEAQRHAGPAAMER